MKDNNTTAKSGRLAEDLAANYLVRHGVTILTRNFSCRGGEIDLIGAENNTLIFVEVRLRRNKYFGGAAASITPAKQKRIINAAQYYLMKHAKSNSRCRFDCILLNSLDETKIEWVRDAFSAS